MSTIAVDQVSIGPNRRAVKEDKVAELMESIKTNGLLNPITIDQNFKLIAGLHRLTACKLLGLPTIECTIITCADANQARLAEIDENLIRSELNALERAELWLERDRILDDLGLRAKSGTPRSSKRNDSKKKGEIISPLPKTTLELAKETGYTDRTFQHGKQIARDIAPEVKDLIRPTELANSPTALLKVARAAAAERQQAEQAEQAAAQAEARQQIDESIQQQQIAAAARTKQKEQQILVLETIAIEKAAKRTAKQGQRSWPRSATAPLLAEDLRVQLGDEWLLGRHAVYCSRTTEPQFISWLPSNAALAIATVSSTWDHNYLVNEAKVVAVLRSAETLHDFCRHHQMPFQFGWISGQIYVAVFSEQPLPPLPITPEVRDRGIEDIVAYLISAYTQPGNFVIAPELSHGEVLIACERMGRTCFAGEANPDRVREALGRWQSLTGKQATLA